MSDRPSTRVLNAQDVCAWRSQTVSMLVTDEEQPADGDEPPDQRTPQNKPSFYRTVSTQKPRPCESLLTRALHTETTEIEVVTDLTRRRSLVSITSLASTADLTSDGGFTSPTRTNTPSPPLPATCAPLVPMSLNLKSQLSQPLEPDHEITPQALDQPKPTTVAPTPKKRCITFACAAQKPTAVTAKPAEKTPVAEPTKRACSIKFACPAPRTDSKAKLIRRPSPAPRARETRPPPAMPLVQSPESIESHIEAAAPVTVQTPISIRPGRPKFLSATEDELDSEATRFHEFASGELHDDDWVRRDESSHKEKLTINDTLKKENIFRQLGQEVEDEAGDNEDDLDDDTEDALDELDDDDEEDDEDEDDDMINRSDASDIDEDASDGNETDNEAGFADSDDESDPKGEYEFWTTSSKPADVSLLRPSANRRESISSIDSLKHMSPVQRRRTRSFKSKSIKIRPGTPDLPDSTDFVCGTLDEDRPLEDAYVSCMEARKRMRQHTIPQDIDPSFPTSDPENDDDDNDSHHTVVSSDEHMFMHGQFEDLEERPGRRRSVYRTSPIRSPRGQSPTPIQRLRSPAPKQRLRSPPPKQRLRSPPPKQRLRSPPPRKLFGGSPPPPRRLRSPPAIASPRASPTGHSTAAIAFVPLAQRPGPTLTKSLPRAPGVFSRQFPCRLSAICDDGEESNNEGGHTRGAIDIVKGLEQKRQRRKEKFWQKHCNRARKGLPERRAVPGKGCERMRELGLQMAGKNEPRSKKAEYVLSV